MEHRPEQVPDDHVMTRDEEQLVNTELFIANTKAMIAKLNEMGFPVPEGMFEALKKGQYNKNIIHYLRKMKTPEEYNEALQRFGRGDFPPEIFQRDDNFIVEGNDTVN